MLEFFVGMVTGVLLFVLGAFIYVCDWMPWNILEEIAELRLSVRRLLNDMEDRLGQKKQRN